jgi:dGTPase
LQSLRVVDELEERYLPFNGLNLAFETREGVLKHCSRNNAEQLEQTEPNGVGRRFLDGTQPSLEAQLCNLADEIAYNAHDIDDGVRSGLITMDQLEAVPLFVRFRDATLQEYPDAKGRRLLFDTIRRMLSQQVYDVIDATRANLAEHMPSTADEARQCPPLVRFTQPMREASTQLKRFLFKELYRHPQVNETTASAKLVLSELFEAYVNDPTAMATDFAQRDDKHRAVADYIAGMTDRFAMREHERLTGRRLLT